MENLRELIQSTLTTVSEYDPVVDVGVPVPDDVIEEGKTYFGYYLSENYLDGDFDKNYSMQVNLIGYLVRRNNAVENTLSIMDEALDFIKSRLKSLNFRYRYTDVSLDNNIRKIQITATVKYNEINYWLV